MDIKDRIVVVTGGGSGIGEALAVAAAGAGARHVVAADLNGTEAERVAALVNGTGVELDVSDESAIAALVEETEQRHGPIDLFCSNAGFVTVAGLEESNEILNRMWEVHVMAHIYAARAVLPSMIARGEGHLLNTAVGGRIAEPDRIGRLRRHEARRGGAGRVAVDHPPPPGIGVSVLCPQAVRTNIWPTAPTSRIEPWATTWIRVWPVPMVCSRPTMWPGCAWSRAENRFWVLPHPEVAEYVRRKGDDIERWLVGMRRFQSMLYPDGPLPGDAIAPKL